MTTELELQQSEQIHRLQRDLAAAQERERGMREAIAFLSKLRDGGAIVSSGQCPYEEIAIARGCCRFYVDAEHFGYVYRPPAPAPSAEPMWGIWCTWNADCKRPPGETYKDGWLHGRAGSDSSPSANVTFYCKADAQSRADEYEGNGSWLYEVRPLPAPSGEPKTKREEAIAWSKEGEPAPSVLAWGTPHPATTPAVDVEAMPPTRQPFGQTEEDQVRWLLDEKGWLGTLDAQRLFVTLDEARAEIARLRAAPPAEELTADELNAAIDWLEHSTKYHDGEYLLSALTKLRTWKTKRDP